jgi:dihydroneopterin aldolase
MAVLGDVIRIRNMTFHACHGVWDEEQEIGQRFEVDLDLITDTRTASRSDKLKDTIDLYDVFQVVQDVVQNNKFRLVETMAGRIAEAVFRKFTVLELLVRVRKPHAPIRGIQDGIEIEIIRRPEDF